MKTVPGATWAAVPAGAAVLYSSATITAGFIQLAAVAMLFAWAAVVAALTYRRNRHAVWSAVPALILVGAAGAAFTNLPDQAMLAFVRDDLRRIAETDRPGRAGPYRVGEPLREGTAVLLPVSGTGWIFSHEGFVYAPDGASTIPPLGEGAESLDFWHLDGPWYRYYMQES